MSVATQIDSKAERISHGQTEQQGASISPIHGSKQEPVLKTSSVSSSQESAEQSSEATPWQTRWLRVGPLSGIFCIGLACCSLLASLAILVASNHSPTGTWKYQPSTYLAICTAFANQSMRYAAVQGVIIAWWTKALNSSTLAGLHQAWHAGFTIRGAIGAGRHMGFLGLATIFSTIVAVDGPLLQRASTVISAPIYNIQVPLNVTITPELPRNWTGGWEITFPPVEETFNTTMPSSSGLISNNIDAGLDAGAFTRAASSWLESAPMSGYIKGCPGICRAKVLAPAISVQSCVTASEPLTWLGPWRPSRGTGVQYAAPLGQMGILVSASLMIGDHEKIDLVTGYATSSRCSGSFTYTACTLESAVGEYDVTVNGDGNIRINGSPKIRAVANNTAITDRTPDQNHESTLGGILAALDQKWYTNCYLWEASNNNSKPGVNVQATGPNCVAYVNPADSGRCPSYLDPRDDVLADLNELIPWLTAYDGVTRFRTGAAASLHPYYTHEAFLTLLDPGITVNTSTMGELQGNHNVFETDFTFYIAAALVELVCIALVLPTYWGFWRLGRTVSLSPVETAKAFEAPLFQACNSNSTGGDIVRTAGTTRVSYGVTGVGATANGSKRLAITETSTRPTNGSKYEA